MPSGASAIVAIPACNEAERIIACLAALAVQRDRYGAPIPAGAFEILVFANNCTDATAELANGFSATCPHPIVVMSEALASDRSNAGWARKRAMAFAAARLESGGQRNGVLLTTDADSCVSPTWFAATLEEFEHGVDCVAGYIDADPAEITRLGPSFLCRGRLEDRYLRLAAEIATRCDPRLHDPWPNHRVSSGASLAVTLQAFRAIGGIPAKALGEDVAFTQALECAGFRVRHSMAVTVTTSCRLDGRATGGAADTMKRRHAVADSPCDDDLGPALPILRRALIRGGLRRSHQLGILGSPRWPRRLGLPPERWSALIEEATSAPFAEFWTQLEAESPILSARSPLRPADLPRQIRRAEAILTWLRRPKSQADVDAKGRIRIVDHDETALA